MFLCIQHFCDEYNTKTADLRFTIAKRIRRIGKLIKHYVMKMYGKLI
jgi:hypothetical protein